MTKATDKRKYLTGASLTVLEDYSMIIIARSRQAQARAVAESSTPQFIHRGQRE